MQWSRGIMLTLCQLTRPILLALIIATAPASLAFSADQDPVAVVKKFNAAITARDIDTALSTLADGSVQLQLRAIHPGMSDNPPLTADLQKNWQMVAAIVFPTTEAYERTVSINSSVVDGDVATVWADAVTRTKRKNEPDAMVLRFSEVYLLVNKTGAWQIAAIADNRKPDTIAVEPEG